MYIYTHNTHFKNMLIYIDISPCWCAAHSVLRCRVRRFAIPQNRTRVKHGVCAEWERSPGAAEPACINVCMYEPNSTYVTCM